ncbi:MAG: hypothetical protein JNJ57_19945, partial [Saprospiraceae bacterium]|nr:hypothetical protein [Saprospiraceae bacterium]
MKIKIILVLFFAGLYACSGPKDFLSPNFRKKGREHKTLAVLPFQVNNMGKAPASLTADQLAKIEEDEAKAFQQSLYNNLTNNLGPSRLQ